MKQALIVTLIALALAAAFWDPLLRGGGFIGGDVYSYYFPQKEFFAERLKHGETPLWNPLAGNGYPVLGESQTGALYPFHQILYRLFNVHTAYHVNHLVHYVLAFGFLFLLARSQGLGRPASGLAAVIYVYSWFPVRTCWEWAIVGGAWLPLAVWSADRLVECGRKRDVIRLALVLMVQMLAGHFQIAFITQLTVAAWIAFRLFRNWSSPSHASQIRIVGLAGAAVGLGFALAAVQIFPTAELRQNSQRAEFGELHNPARGRTPWQSLTQVFGWIPQQEPTGVAGQFQTRWTPWCSPLTRRDEMLQKWSGSVPTNQMEATVYWGLIPLGLAIFAAIAAVCGVHPNDRFWLGMAVAGVLYATGVFTPVLKFLPGFGWFHGPGRWGLLVSVAISLLAGRGWEILSASHLRLGHLLFALWTMFSLFTIDSVVSDVDFIARETASPATLTFCNVEVTESRLMPLLAVLAAATLFSLWRIGRNSQDRTREQSAAATRYLFAGLCTLTILDFWIASRIVTYSPMTLDPPLNHLEESFLRSAIIEDAEGRLENVRIQSPGGNLMTILGVSSTPPYFTFGPREYVEPLPLPEVPEGLPKRSAESASRLRRSLLGVNYILSFEQRDEQREGLVLIWSGIDQFFNPALGRYREPVFLYRVVDAPGRLRWNPPPRERTWAEFKEFLPDRVTIDAQTLHPSRLIFTDLLYRGWTVTIDGEPATAIRENGWFRAVDVPAGLHRIVWTYRPASVYWGAAVSAIALGLLACDASFTLWRRQRRHSPREISALE